MSMRKAQERVCSEGHKYYKSTDCPTCPICESQRVPAADYMQGLSAPARRALEREGIMSLEQLSTYSEKRLLSFHGLGPSSLPKLRDALQSKGLGFVKER